MPVFCTYNAKPLKVNRITQVRNSVNLKELRQRWVAKQLSNPTASVERCLSSVLYMRYDKHMLSADVGWQ